MNIYTVHEMSGAAPGAALNPASDTASDGAPVLVPEGFSWAALFFSVLWLAVHGALLAAVVLLALFVLLSHAPPELSTPVVAGLVVASGVFGRDLWRLSLHWRGYVETAAIAAASPEAALLRLADLRAANPGRANP